MQCPSVKSVSKYSFSDTGRFQRHTDYTVYSLSVVCPSSRSSGLARLWRDGMPEESRSLDSLGTKNHRVNPRNPCLNILFLTQVTFGDTQITRFILSLHYPKTVQQLLLPQTQAKLFCSYSRHRRDGVPGKSRSLDFLGPKNTVPIRVSFQAVKAQIRVHP